MNKEETQEQDPPRCDATTRIGGFGGSCIDGTISCERTDEHNVHFNRSHCRTGHSWVAVYTPRDQLAEILYKQGAYCGTCDYESRCPDCDKVLGDYADAVITSGWRPPARVIETPENEGDYAPAIAELDALPRGTVIKFRSYVYQSIGSGWWESMGRNRLFTTEQMIDVADGSDIVVLWEPESGAA